MNLVKENKRYYWIKLAKEFFNSKEMKLIRKIAGGSTYTIIYLKIMLMSLEDDGVVYFDGVGENLAEEIALVIDEDLDNVKVTLSFLESKGLMTERSEGEFFLEQVPEMVGSETDSTRRSRKHRGKKALQCNTNATKRNGEIEIEIEKEKELNKESEVDIKNKAAAASLPSSDFNLFEYYQQRIGSLDGYQYEKLKDFIEIDNMEPLLAKRAIDRAADNGKRNFGYVNAILKNWAQNGINTIVKQDEEQRNWDDQKASKNQKSSKASVSSIPEWSNPNYKEKIHQLTEEEEQKILEEEERLRNAGHKFI